LSKVQSVRRVKFLLRSLYPSHQPIHVNPLSHYLSQNGPSYNYASEGTYNLKISPKQQTENNITNKSSSLNTTMPNQLPSESINGSKVGKI
jgi:hypothetical protein